ncbi:MAG: hypothetical protein ACPG3U_02965 [Rhodothermales bacterium]
MTTLSPAARRVFCFRTRLHSLFGVLLVISMAALHARGQTPAASPQEAFPSLRIGASGGMVFRESGMPGWSPGADGRLTIDTPYAGGRLRLDTAYRAWTGSSEILAIVDRDGGTGQVSPPDVQTIDILAGWGLSNAPDAPIFLEAGLLLGNRFMLFDLPHGTAARFESEMLAGPWIRVGRIAGPVRLFGEVRALRVLTNPRWDTIGLSGGIAVEFATPGWIRWILR